ncbi:MAG: hypothetical protein AAF492_03705, partial [Verrucomicrobiota bacterium]
PQNHPNFIPASDRETPLRLLDVSLKQFLVCGLPNRTWLPWNGTNQWDIFDPQYRLELCHSEISRWSIIFKQSGKVQGDANIEGGDGFTDIELVNNCTTVKGFEFKVRRDGRLFHGSFGKDGLLEPVYQKLSEWQAGSRARQEEELDDDGRTFWTIYGNPLDPSKNIEIHFDRYRQVDTSAEARELSLAVEEGPIDYARWGVTSEYFQKPQVRRLIHSIVDSAGTETLRPEPPETYLEIKEATSISFPQFTESGVYDLSDRQSKPRKHYAPLYAMDQCIVRTLIDGRKELDLRISSPGTDYGLRRIVMGNLDLDALPIYPETFTFHRFGYGARDTVSTYDPDYVPASDVLPVAHYAYLLGGDGAPDEATTYIIPENYGVERLVLSWDDYHRTVLTVDIIGFERILPIWQGHISFTDDIA